MYKDWGRRGLTARPGKWLATDGWKRSSNGPPDGRPAPLSRSAPTIRAEFGQKVRGGGVKKVGTLGVLGVLRVGCNATKPARGAAMCSTAQANRSSSNGRDAFGVDSASRSLMNCKASLMSSPVVIFRL